MYSEKIRASSFWAWACAALVGPVAVYSAGCSWLLCLVLGLVSGTVCVLVLKLPAAPVPKGVTALELIWCLTTALWLLGESGRIWPRADAHPAVALVLLALGVWSVSDGQRGPRIGSVTFRLLAILVGFVLVCALGDVRPAWTVPQLYGQWQPLAAVLLLPAAGVFLCRERKEEGLWWAVPGMLATVTALCAGGVMAPWVAGELEEPLWELGRSVRVFGKAANLESLLCAGQIFSWFCGINFLLTVACALGERLLPQKGKWNRWVLGGILGIGVLLPWRPGGALLFVGSTVFWVLFPLLTQAVGFLKNFAKK